MIDSRILLTQSEGRVFIVLPTGDVGGFVSEQVSLEVDDVLAELDEAAANEVVVDFSNVKFFGSCLLAAIQRIWNTSREDPFLLEKRSPVWLNDDTINMQDIGNWDNDGADDDDTSLISSLDSAARFTAVDVRISLPGSLEMTGTNVHDFAIYGLSEHNDGRVFIQIGYRERF